MKSISHGHKIFLLTGRVNRLVIKHDLTHNKFFLRYPRATVCVSVEGEFATRTAGSARPFGSERGQGRSGAMNNARYFVLLIFLVCRDELDILNLIAIP
ncbi:hypothetical protein [Klebsiella oxytoca]|uniref:hypothetical protein n=1 Tax=Klebsiella oxytoca TaxID=571 RepID=UPI003570BDCB